MEGEWRVSRDEDRLLNFLRNEVWPRIPSELRGVPLTKEDEEAILGYGDDGA